MKIFRLICNWTVVLTSPVWILPVLLGSIALEIYQEKSAHTSDTRSVFIKGDDWILR